MAPVLGEVRNVAAGTKLIESVLQNSNVANRVFKTVYCVQETVSAVLPTRVINVGKKAGKYLRLHLAKG